MLKESHVKYLKWKGSKVSGHAQKSGRVELPVRLRHKEVIIHMKEIQSQRGVRGCLPWSSTKWENNWYTNIVDGWEKYFCGVSKKKKKKPICNCTASEKCFLCVSIHVSLSVIKTAWPQRIQNRMQNHGNPANRREKRAIYKKNQTKKRTIGSYECCGTIFCNDTKWHKINLNQMLQRGECSGEKKGIAQKPKVMWPHV